MDVSDTVMPVLGKKFSETRSTSYLSISQTETGSLIRRLLELSTMERQESKKSSPYSYMWRPLLYVHTWLRRFCYTRVCIKIPYGNWAPRFSLWRKKDSIKGWLYQAWGLGTCLTITEENLIEILFPFIRRIIFAFFLVFVV